VERIPLRLLALACALALGLALPAAAPAGTARARCSGASAIVSDHPVNRTAARDALLCLLNVERRARGVRALRANPRLQAAALGQARWMVRHRWFSHYRPGGPDLVGRLRKVDYIPRSGTWLVGENIGFGLPRRSSPSAQVRAWMASPPHRANILNPRFQAAGLGIYSGTPRGSRSRGATYAVTFGSRL
jgi:uncharacterized protein YkwD